MSRISLARRLALRRADATLFELPRFPVDANPLRVAAYLLAFRSLRDAAASAAVDAAADDAIGPAAAVTSVLADIDAAISAAEVWLQRSAGAGRSPALKGHGCPAPLSAVGSASVSQHDADITATANCSLICHASKELQKTAGGVFNREEVSDV